MGDEFFYFIIVEIEQFKLVDNGIYCISGLILVECEMQKCMIIGKGGKYFKIIGEYVCKDMENLFDNKVFLEFWVKVK